MLRLEGPLTTRTSSIEVACQFITVFPSLVDGEGEGKKNLPSNHRTVRSSDVPVKDFQFSFLPTECASFVGHHLHRTTIPCSPLFRTFQFVSLVSIVEESIFHSHTHSPFVESIELRATCEFSVVLRRTLHTGTRRLAERKTHRETRK